MNYCSWNANTISKEKVINYSAETWKKFRERELKLFLSTWRKVVIKNVENETKPNGKYKCFPNNKMFQTQGLIYYTRMEWTQGLGGVQLLRLTANKNVERWPSL